MCISVYILLKMQNSNLYDDLIGVIRAHVYDLSRTE